MKYKVTRSTKIELDNQEYILDKNDEIEIVPVEASTHEQIEEWLYNLLLESKGSVVSISDIAASYPFGTKRLNPAFEDKIAELVEEIEIEYNIHIDYIDLGEGPYDYGYSVSSEFNNMFKEDF